MSGWKLLQATHEKKDHIVLDKETLSALSQRLLLGFLYLGLWRSTGIVCSHYRRIIYE